MEGQNFAGLQLQDDASFFLIFLCSPSVIIMVHMPSGSWWFAPIFHIFLRYLKPGHLGPQFYRSRHSSRVQFLCEPDWTVRLVVRRKFANGTLRLFDSQTWNTICV